MSIGTVISSEDKPHSASITWTIDGFRYRFNTIVSPLIKLSTGITFQLTLRPLCIADKVEYLTVFLISPNAKDLSSWLSIVKANGNKCFTHANPHVEDSFIERAEVLNVVNGYLIDGKLTVHCEVIYKDKATDKGEHPADDNVASALLTSLLESAKYSDAILVVGGKEFHVHKNILTSRSCTNRATEGWKHLEEIGPKHCDLLFDLLKAVAK